MHTVRVAWRHPSLQQTNTPRNPKRRFVGSPVIIVITVSTVIIAVIIVRIILLTIVMIM